MNKKKLKKEFKDKFHKIIWEQDIDLIFDWFSSTLDTELAKRTEEMIDLSEQIELESETTLEEWKALKRLRNTLRDRYFAISETKG